MKRQVSYLPTGRNRSASARRGTTDRPVALCGGRFELEQSCWDPKDGELCLSRMKPEETLVEVRSGSDVQIDRRTWV